MDGVGPPAPRIVTVAFALEDRGPASIGVQIHCEGNPTPDEVAHMTLAMIDALAMSLKVTRGSLLIDMLQAPAGEANLGPEDR